MNELKDENVEQLNVFFPKGNTLCTEPFSRFLDEFHSHTEFFFFICHIVGKMDQNRVVAAKALLANARNQEEKLSYERTINQPDKVLNELKRHGKISSQNLTNGIVNSFQRYFSSIVQAVAIKRPAVLSSSQTIKVDDVLRFTKHRDLVSFMVDRKVNELSYGGLSDLEKYFDDRLGIEMFSENDQRDMLRIFFEARNINVHNGAVVNEIFSNRVGKVEGFPYKIGKVFRLDLDDLAKLSSNAMSVALKIDRIVGEKFKLKRRTHNSWKSHKNT